MIADNASDFATLSATFTDFPEFNSDLADDFVVPTGETWNVQSIDADGVHSFQRTGRQFQCVLPCRQCRSSRHVQRNESAVSGGRHHFFSHFTSVAVLAEGTYWVEIQANMTFLPNGAVLGDRTLQANQR